MVTALLVLFAAGAGFWIYRQKQLGIQERELEFPLSNLLELEPFGSFEPERDLVGPFAVMLYYSELSCNTCTAEALVELAELYKRHGDQIRFLLVVHGQDPIDLGNLRRVGRVQFPILLENEDRLGLPQQFCGILDLNKQKFVYSFIPKMDRWEPQRMAGLERRLINLTR